MTEPAEPGVQFYKHTGERTPESSGPNLERLSRASESQGSGCSQDGGEIGLAEVEFSRSVDPRSVEETVGSSWRRAGRTGEQENPSLRGPGSVKLTVRSD